MRRLAFLLLAGCHRDCPPADSAVDTAAPAVRYGGCEATITTSDGTGAGFRRWQTYDERGLLVKDTWAANLVDDPYVTSAYTWSDDGRLLTMEMDRAPFGDVDERATYAWDGPCNTSVTDVDLATSATTVTTHVCDDQGRVVESDGSDAIRYSDYDDAGDLVEVRDDYRSDGTIEVAYAYAYDQAHHLLVFGEDYDQDGVPDPGPQSNVWRHGLLTVAYAGDTRIEYAYDEAGRETLAADYAGLEPTGQTQTTWVCP